MDPTGISGMRKAKSGGFTIDHPYRRKTVQQTGEITMLKTGRTKQEIGAGVSLCRTQRGKKNTQKGFTLAELLIVVSIIALSS